MRVYDFVSCSRLPIMFLLTLTSCSGIGEAMDAVSEPGDAGVSCAQLDPFRCEREHADRCAVTERVGVDVTLGCYSNFPLAIDCRDIAICDTGQVLGRAAGGVFIYRGCIDTEGGYEVITNPSAPLQSAAQTACDDLPSGDDETCRGFTTNECPMAAPWHCELSVGHHFDLEGDCIDFSVSSVPECRLGRIVTARKLVRDLDGNLWLYPPQSLPPVDWESVESELHGDVPLLNVRSCSN